MSTQRIAELEAVIEALRATRDHLMSARFTPVKTKRHGQAVNGNVRGTRDVVDAIKKAEAELRHLTAPPKPKPAPTELTRADFDGVTEVCVLGQWKRAEKVNAKSVSVIWCEGTPQAEREAIPFSKITGIRSAS